MSLEPLYSRLGRTGGEAEPSGKPEVHKFIYRDGDLLHTIIWLVLADACNRRCLRVVRLVLDSDLGRNAPGRILEACAQAVRTENLATLDYILSKGPLRRDPYAHSRQLERAVRRGLSRGSKELVQLLLHYQRNLTDIVKLDTWYSKTGSQESDSTDGPLHDEHSDYDYAWSVNDPHPPITQYPKKTRSRARIKTTVSQRWRRNPALDLLPVLRLAHTYEQLDRIPDLLKIHCGPVTNTTSRPRTRSWPCLPDLSSHGAVRQANMRSPHFQGRFRIDGLA